MSNLARLAPWLLLAVGCLACEEEKSKSTSAADAAAANAPVVDPSLAKAVASARTAAPGPAATTEGDGPPPTGVFEPGKADALHKKGAPPKLTLGSAGKEPRITLSTDVKPGWKKTGTVAVALRAGRQMLPPIALTIAFEAQKPKAGEEAQGVPVVGKVTAAKLGDIQGQAPPKELTAQIAKIKGSRIEYRVLDNGVAVDHRHELPAGSDPNLNTILRSATETLAATHLAYPSEAVGDGAYWLITSREFISGADVVQYRLIKLAQIQGDQLSISINAKRYSAAPRLTLQGLPPGDLTLDEFQSTADGAFQVKKGAAYPSSGELKSVLNASLIPADQPDQRMGVQSLSDATLTF